MYCEVDDVRNWIAVTDSRDEMEIGAALLAADRSIDVHCGQRFEMDDTASPRQFQVGHTGVVDLGAQYSVIGTTAGMIVATDDNDDGVFETTWLTTDWRSEPLSGVGPDGRTGWPITRLVAIADRTFPRLPLRHGVQITARWGWAVTPDPIKLAARMLAVAWHHRRATVTGQGGFDQFFASAIRDDPTIADLLSPYRHGTAIVGIG